VGAAVPLRGAAEPAAPGEPVASSSFTDRPLPGVAELGQGGGPTTPWKMGERLPQASTPLPQVTGAV
jgi:hypothetical protein